MNRPASSLQLGSGKNYDVGSCIQEYFLSSPGTSGAGRTIIEGANIHIFVFTDCKNNRFQKKLINYPPPPNYRSGGANARH